MIDQDNRLSSPTHGANKKVGGKGGLMGLSSPTHGANNSLKNDARYFYLSSPTHGANRCQFQASDAHRLSSPTHGANITVATFIYVAYTFKPHAWGKLFKTIHIF